jgi:hypothetical protein
MESVSNRLRSPELGIYPGGECCDSMPQARAVETAAQFNQVLRTEDGVGFEPTFAALSKGFIPAGCAPTQERLRGAWEPGYVGRRWSLVCPNL